jgi:protein-tyrosine phosphatase
MTPADIVLARDLGLHTIFDLRSPPELEEDGLGALFDDGLARHRHAPFFRNETGVRPGGLNVEMLTLYIEMLDLGREAIGDVFTALAEEPTYPAVFHCAAGKDRTGVVSALLLRVLNVGDATIAADYALSGEYITPRLEAEWAQSEEALRKRYGEVPAHIHRADPETILQTLEFMDAQYGSVQAYLAGCGVGADQLDALRRHLLR